MIDFCGGALWLEAPDDEIPRACNKSNRQVCQARQEFMASLATLAAEFILLKHFCQREYSIV
jgi:hypothetical protein